MRINSLLMAVVLCVFVSGCADIDVPGPGQLLRGPLGEGSLKVGMSKSQAISIYGEPDKKGRVVSGEWKGEREEWMYSARYPVLPVNAGYLAENLYLYFDDDRITNMSQKSLSQIQEEKSGYAEPVK
ncbi:MAG: hypothetical protein ABH869_08055 [Candidatus Omnitrophota bacterium]